MPCPVAVVPWHRAHFEEKASERPDEVCPLPPDGRGVGESSELEHPMTTEANAIAVTTKTPVAFISAESSGARSSWRSLSAATHGEHRASWRAFELITQYRTTEDLEKIPGQLPWSRLTLVQDNSGLQTFVVAVR